MCIYSNYEPIKKSTIFIQSMIQLKSKFIKSEPIKKSKFIFERVKEEENT